MKVDIIIMGCHERDVNIDILLNKLELSKNNVVYDNNHDGPLSTALKAWTYQYNSEITHRILLQDDAAVCDNFKQICERIVVAHPNEVIALFPFDTIKIEFEHSDTPYYDLKIFSGVGIIMPVKYIDGFCIYAKEHPFKDKDNWTLYNYCKEQNIRMIQTVPALVQHLGDYSLYDTNADVRRVKCFDENPVANWDSKEIITPKYYSEFEREMAKKLEWSKQYIKNLAKERSQNNDK